jgi:aerobic carbon-monoxide dehydrogenase medium subunit
MHEFDYHEPKRVEDVTQLLSAKGDAKVLAGGMSLLPALKLRLARYSDLVSLDGVEGIRGISRISDAVVIGAMTRHHEVAYSADVRQAVPALATLAGEIGDPMVRNRGTIGGSIANADPAADYPSAVLGLGATVVTDRRAIAGDDFFTGLFETALAPGEIITEVSFPIPQTAAYVKLPNPASRFALVGIFVARFADRVRVAVTGAGPCVFRLERAESMLATQFSSSALDRLKIEPEGLSSDIHATAEYRAHAVGVVLKRAVELASQG